VHPQPSRSAPHAPTEPMWSDRANRSRALPDSRDLVILHYCSVILHYRLSFCYNELNHFARVNSVILLDILEILAQSFCMNSAIFATVLSDSTLLQWSAIPCATVFSHSSLLHCFVIFHLYSAQPFCIAIVLSHSSCKRSSVIHCYYSAQSFSTVKVVQSLLQLSHFPLL
jgi:hypothetical protein